MSYLPIKFTRKAALSQKYKSAQGALDALRRANLEATRFKYALVRCEAGGWPDVEPYKRGRLYTWKLQRARHGGAFAYPVPPMAEMLGEVIPPRDRTPKTPEWMLERRKKWQRRKGAAT